MNKKKIECLVKALEKTNAKDIKIYDLKNRNNEYDIAIIATATAVRQVNAIISNVNEIAKEEGIKIKNVCGRNSNWVAIDLFDTVVHYFTFEERERYNLDSIYANCLIEK